MYLHLNKEMVVVGGGGEERMVVIFGPANSPARTDCTIIKELLPAGRQAAAATQQHHIDLLD